MDTTHKSKQEILADLECLIKSCEEGMDGTWDASMPDCDEGFDAMIIQLEGVIRYVNNQKD